MSGFCGDRGEEEGGEWKSEGVRVWEGGGERGRWGERGWYTGWE